jgi:hypothetical protein
LPAEDVVDAQVDLQRGDLIWSGIPGSPVMQVNVHSVAGGGGEKRAVSNEAANDWGAFVDGEDAAVWGTSPSRKAQVDLAIEAHDEVNIDAVLLDGYAWLAETRGDHELTATGVAVREHTGSLDAYVTDGGIDAILRPGPGDHIRLESHGGDVFVGLPAGLELDLEVVADANYGMDVADLDFDTYLAEVGYFSAWRGEGKVVVRITVEEGFVVIYSLAGL